MKRLALAAALLVVPIAVQAFDPDKPETIRIGVMKYVAIPADRYGTPVKSIPGHLRDELRRAGFDAFTLDTSLEELEQRTDRDADFYVEVISADNYNDAFGGIDIYGQHSTVRIGVVKTHVEARIRVYDGRTLELFAQFDLDKEHRAVAPTGVGIGGRNVGIWAGLPLGWFQYRNAARSIAKSAAVKVADAVRDTDTDVEEQ